MPNKILIVDDDAYSLDLLEQELTDQGYAIERANDGEEALRKVDAFPHLALNAEAGRVRHGNWHEKRGAGSYF